MHDYYDLWAWADIVGFSVGCYVQVRWGYLWPTEE